MIAAIDVTNIKIETDRLFLRSWQEADLPDFYEYARVDGVGQMAGWAPHDSMEKSRQILSHFIRDKKTFAIELKETGKVIGSLGLEERDWENAPGFGREIGYVLSKDHWGRGLMPEAVKAVISYCFETLDYDWLSCGHFLRNDRSRRVVEKCGFQFQREQPYETAMGTMETVRMYLMENGHKIMGRMSAPVDASAITLETERLTLRPVRIEDRMDLHDVVSDEAVTQQAGFACCRTLTQTHSRVKQYIDDNETLALVLKENGKVIGTVSLQKRPWQKYPIDRQLKGRELGFDLGREYWGRGLMPEAVRAVCDYCFDTLDYDFVTCGHFVANAQSARAIEKCGFAFQFETTADYPDGRREPVRSYIRYNDRRN